MNENVIEILTEEASMEIFLRGLLPKILPKDYAVDINCFIRPHEGKSHLQKSIPNKMKAYPRFGYPVKVLIVHDQDANDCKTLKEDLLKLCDSGKKIFVVVRIACRELENWYLGDLNAIESVYPESKARGFAKKEKFRNVDYINGTHEIKQLTNNFSKSHAAREIVKYMDINANKSVSFNQFISGLNKLIAK